MPLHQVFEDSQAAFACHLESFTPRKSFTRAQREKLEHLILETCRSIDALRTVKSVQAYLRDYWVPYSPFGFF